MIRKASLHRGRDAQGLANAAKVVIHEVECNRMAVIFKLFREGIREPGETAHGHTHGEILSLYKGRAHVLRIGTPTDNLHIAANAAGRGTSAAGPLRPERRKSSEAGRNQPLLRRHLPPHQGTRGDRPS